MKIVKMKPSKGTSETPAPAKDDDSDLFQGEDFLDEEVGDPYEGNEWDDYEGNDWPFQGMSRR